MTMNTDRQLAAAVALYRSLRATEPIVLLLTEMMSLCDFAGNAFVRFVWNELWWLSAATALLFSSFVSLSSTAGDAATTAATTTARSNAVSALKLTCVLVLLIALCFLSTCVVNAVCFCSASSGFVYGIAECTRRILKYVLSAPALFTLAAAFYRFAPIKATHALLVCWKAAMKCFEKAILSYLDDDPIQ